ncbi:MAG TPA: hypothetical protein VL992_17480 [Tepidisphaeraceae bacterium]|nr:hypothetical protein [Tepidisphaeraceae bacterium]
MEFSLEAFPQATLTAGAVLLYAGGRTAAAALAQNAPSPGRRALGHWLPIAAIASIAAASGQVNFALAIIFATSVASLGLVGGCIAVMGPNADEPELWPSPARKSASILLPATVLVFIAGFAATITLLASILMLAMGALILFLRLDPADRAGESNPPKTKPFTLLIAVAISCLGAWAAVTGSVGINATMDFSSPIPVVATVLSPLLVASMLLGGSTLASRGAAWAASATNVGVAQLNLCLLLPLLALTWQARHDHALYYPMPTWRVDAVTLMVLAAALLPSAAGRWRPGRIEGVTLLAIYVAYVLANIVVSVMV